MRSSDEPTEHGSDSTGRPGKRRVLLGCAAIGACALLTAACGSAAAPSSASAGTHSSPSGTSSPGTTSAAKISLSISFSASAGIPAKHYTLRCEPAGGTAPHPAAACSELMKHGASLFAPLRVQIACPMVMAAARRATVTGTYLGRPVHEVLADGGCDLSRFAEFGKIFR